MSLSGATIRLISWRSHNAGVIALSVAQASPAKYLIRTNKRGNPTHAVERGRHLPLAPFSNHGFAYQQQLPDTGRHVWALKGAG